MGYCTSHYLLVPSTDLRCSLCHSLDLGNFFPIILGEHQHILFYLKKFILMTEYNKGKHSCVSSRSTLLTDLQLFQVLLISLIRMSWGDISFYLWTNWGRPHEGSVQWFLQEVKITGVHLQGDSDPGSLIAPRVRESFEDRWSVLRTVSSQAHPLDLFPKLTQSWHK